MLPFPKRETHNEVLVVTAMNPFLIRKQPWMRFRHFLHIKRAGFKPFDRFDQIAFQAFIITSISSSFVFCWFVYLYMKYKYP